MHEIRVVAGKRFDDVSSTILAAVPSSLFRCQGPPKSVATRIPYLSRF